MSKSRSEKSARVRRISDLIADHMARRHEKYASQGNQQTGQQKRSAIMRRKASPDPEKVKLKIPRLIAYDFETTRIEKGTPKPLYLTAYGADIVISTRVRNIEHLCDIVTTQMLLPEYAGCRFVAHNGNKFDAYIIAASLLHDPEYHIAPYLANDSNFRGMKITHIPTDLSWEFLDSLSMTGVTKPLKDFLETFAPDYGKLKGPDFETETFSAANKAHVEYAERDSEGLYHAINSAQTVVFNAFGIGLQATVGNLGIKLFQRFIPEGIIVVRPPHSSLTIIRDFLMRGGYCHLQKRHAGPVWRYDINQAYAAAMREANLPAGRCMVGPPKKSQYAKCAMYRVTATHKKNTIPFYYIAISDKKSRFSCMEIEETWLTNSECDQLEQEGWRVQYLESHVWEHAFNMKEYVDRLENLRHTGIGGVKGPQGEMVKAVGNNSYGKTLERLKCYELCMSAEKPEGWGAYYSEDSPMQHVWFRFTRDDKSREYHQPQIGAFITAHVRMVLRRAILQAPESFIYADTDGVSFSKPVNLPLDNKKYGLWKVEAENEQYIFIDKKVYCSEDGLVRHAKGMRLKKNGEWILSIDDFMEWFKGNPPSQVQLQRNSFLKAMSGFEMFREVTKQGTSKDRLKDWQT